jgi:oligopeptide/dipeptide ABC transporter ATP-binding protein
VPIPDPDVERARRRVILSGYLPNPANPPSGCRFRTRCPEVIEMCAAEDPPLKLLAAGHYAACLRV